MAVSSLARADRSPAGPGVARLPLALAGATAARDRFVSSSKRSEPPTNAGSFWEALVYATPFVGSIQPFLMATSQALGATIAATKIPKLPGLVASETTVGKLLAKARLSPVVERVLDSRPFVRVAGVLEGDAPQLAGRVAGRVVPFIGVGFAIYDSRSAYLTDHEAKATALRKDLKIAKAVCSTVAAGAAVATLLLAPTGAGGAIAGGISLGAGLLSAGLGMAINRFAPN